MEEETIWNLKSLDRDKMKFSTREQLVDLNMQLWDDLTRSFESYVVLMARLDLVQREKIDLQYDILVLK